MIPWRSRPVAAAARIWAGAGIADRCSGEANGASARITSISGGVMHVTTIPVTPEFT
jgi:hypothetical protein